MGKEYGKQEITLTEGQLPKHTPQIVVSNSEAEDNRPIDNYIAMHAGADGFIDSPGAGELKGPQEIGNDEPIDVRSPVLAMNYVICTGR